MQLIASYFYKYLTLSASYMEVHVFIMSSCYFPVIVGRQLHILVILSQVK